MRIWQTVLFATVALGVGAGAGAYPAFRFGERQGKQLGEEDGKILGEAVCSNAHRELGHTNEGREKLFRAAFGLGQEGAFLAAKVATGGRIDRGKFDQALEHVHTEMIKGMAERKFPNPDDFMMMRRVLSE